jgi:TRAP-type C4-dicarboxylate transport system permease large subunit
LSILLIGVVYRKLTWKVLLNSLRETVFLTCVLMICIVGARALGMALSMLQVAQTITAFVAQLPINRYIIWTIIVVIYAVLGCLVDGIDLLLITTPVFYPIVVTTLGFDPIWFGVVLVIILEMSLITPPVGFNLFITHTIGGRKDLSDTIKGVFPFIVAMFVCIALLTLFPNLALYLPGKM